MNSTGPGGSVGDDIDVLSRRVQLAAAWPRLTATEQEALALTAWDGLSAPEAAQVLGISPVAFRLRLSRARRTLRRLLDDQIVAVPDWSPTPVALTPAQATAAMATCNEDIDRRTGKPVGEPQLLVGERRGGWTYVSFRPTSTSEASCLLPANPEEHIGYNWGSVDFDVTPEPEPSPGEVQQWTYTIGSTKEGLFSWTEGKIGRDVTGVTITTPVGQRVTASVANGRYAAWWPAGPNKIDSPQISGSVRIEATLRDGTTKVVRAR